MCLVIWETLTYSITIFFSDQVFVHRRHPRRRRHRQHDDEEQEVHEVIYLFLTNLLNFILDLESSLIELLNCCAQPLAPPEYPSLPLFALEYGKCRQSTQGNLQCFVESNCKHSSVNCIL